MYNQNPEPHTRPQQSLLFMNQVNILKDKIFSKMQNSLVNFNNLRFQYVTLTNFGSAMFGDVSRISREKLHDHVTQYICIKGG